MLVFPLKKKTKIADNSDVRNLLDSIKMAVCQAKWKHVFLKNFLSRWKLRFPKTKKLGDILLSSIRCLTK